jgi:hypothetical protein
MRGEDVLAVLEVPELETAELTCVAMPVQIEGKLRDGRWFYFRYRFGRAGIGIGRTEHEAVVDWCGDVGYGTNLGGDLDEGEELQRVFRRAWEARAER